ncbi:MAG: hypothetical protein QOI95_2900 [Acidimicrobiaceae bacterium]|jgi:hypothetical protein
MHRASAIFVKCIGSTQEDLARFSGMIFNEW